MSRVAGRPAGFSYADGKAHFEVVVPKTGGRVRRRRTIPAKSERVALEHFEAFKREVLDALRTRPVSAPVSTPVSTGVSVDEAFKREILDAIQATRTSRGGRPKKPLTFDAFLDLHLEAICSRVQDKAAASYEQFARNHLRPYFGAMPLSDITMPVVQDFHGYLKTYTSSHPRWRGRSLSPASINGCLTVLRLLLRDAHGRGLLPRVPTGRWPKAVEAPLKLEASAEEQRRFLAAFDDEAGFHNLPPANCSRGTRHGHSRFPGRPKTLRGIFPAADPETAAAFARFQALRPLFVVAFHTGLRRGDLLALAWSSVDLNGGVIRVTMQKTDRDAVVPISTACRQALLACRARAPENPRVFTDADGNPVSETLFAVAFSTAKVLAGITRRFRPHDMRHTFASRLASEGVSLQIISMALGHSTITLTQRYAKPNEESLRVIASVLNRQTESPEE